MAHFAEIKEGIVVRVLVVPDEEEHRGQEYLAEDLGLGGIWLKTSYNTLGGIHKNGGTPYKKNFAGVGYHYDSGYEAFYAPQPFPSWKLNYETFIWEAPIPQPEPIQGYNWVWSEINKNWEKAICYSC